VSLRFIHKTLHAAWPQRKQFDFKLLFFDNKLWRALAELDKAPLRVRTDLSSTPHKRKITFTHRHQSACTISQFPLTDNLCQPNSGWGFHWRIVMLLMIYALLRYPAGGKGVIHVANCMKPVLVTCLGVIYRHTSISFNAGVPDIDPITWVLK
jgi:hypothetical protein